MSENRQKAFILWFKDLGINDVPLVGGKNASLGEMYQNMAEKGVAVPFGFAITAHAYEYFLEQTRVKQEIQGILKTLDSNDLKNLQDHGHRVREAILEAELPEDLKRGIEQAYTELSKNEGAGEDIDVAVRSSATAEDMPDASFAGQQETFLNIRGAYEVIDATKRCMASLFTDRAISYRDDKGYDHSTVSLSVGVQKMVRADQAGSGVMFSIDTESGLSHAVLINAAYGLGEMVVQGKVEPDEYYVFKPSLLEGAKKEKSGKVTFKYRPIVGKALGHKEAKMIYSLEGSDPVREVPVPEEDRKQYVLTDDEVLQLAYWACLIEEHYGKPMDIEWAKDGLTGKLYIVQARPETVHAQADKNVLEEYELQGEGKVLTEGVSVGAKIGQGMARVLKDVSEIHDFQKGEVLVTEITDPDWEPIMKIAAAIVTNSGGRTSHAAIVSRELGIPAVVGTKDATAVLKTGQDVTVSCAEGERGFIYEGKVPFELKKTDLGDVKTPKTDIMQIVGDPSRAFGFAMMPNRGVGLARLEMIILNTIKVHPLALLRFDELEDEAVKQEIEELTRNYENKPDFFVDQLALGVSRIVAAFHPHQVIVRLSDFKTNEYANLIGGKQFEPHEENPMIGWRGASRYYSEEYKDAFILECRAMKRVREEMGLTNMKLMIPFVRTPEEGQKVIDILADNGLKQGDNGLEIYMMCEVPSNVILAEEFIKIFDGFSIGSNDLTQLCLGLDRDSSLVAHIYDERNEAVKRLLSQAIKAVHAANKQIGICGQAPSDFPEIAEFLVDEGIDTMSVTPDTALKTWLNVAAYEEKLGKS
ncbi:phosphoenolpyruvate synthase [Nitrospinae bacterium AH_259_B05_G02_I21]|nr:phosphoenolpyruvate synthase [Nitrospinae bacterium AH_259_B05_G02_I21]MDA2932192.1 phosphoenolpyruvate synthase [Nitrospinae bacterium AH-259-F20]